MSMTSSHSLIHSLTHAIWECKFITLSLCSTQIAKKPPCQLDSTCICILNGFRNELSGLGSTHDYRFFRHTLRWFRMFYERVWRRFRSLGLFTSCRSVRSVPSAQSDRSVLTEGGKFDDVFSDTHTVH